MKTIFVTALILIMFIGSGCGSRPTTDASEMASQQAGAGTSELVFREYEHSFGKVIEGEKVGYVFEYENRGTDDLVITSAITSCGCTVPKYDTKPIAPGGKGNLEVIFDTSGRNGMQTKTITVKSNASTPVLFLKITADVVPNNNE